MSLSAEDRAALILGRAIHRAEALQVRVEQLEAELAARDAPTDLEQTKEFAEKASGHRLLRRTSE